MLLWSKRIPWLSQRTRCYSWMQKFFTVTSFVKMPFLCTSTVADADWVLCSRAPEPVGSPEALVGGGACSTSSVMHEIKSKVVRHGYKPETQGSDWIWFFGGGGYSKRGDVEKGWRLDLSNYYSYKAVTHQIFVLWSVHTKWSYDNIGYLVHPISFRRTVNNSRWPWTPLQNTQTTHTNTQSEAKVGQETFFSRVL